MTTTVKVKGMSCNHCVAAVQNALKEVQGVNEVSVSLDAGEVAISHSVPVNMNVIRERIEDAGYELG